MRNYSTVEKTNTPRIESSGSKNNALNQTASAAALPTSFGQALDAYFSQLKEEVQALRIAVLQIQHPASTIDEAEKLLTASQTAELLGICRQTVFDYSKRGLLNAYRLGGRTYFKQREVVASLRGQEEPNGRRKQARKQR